MRFYLLDRVTKITPGESIEGLKCWSLSEDVFTDHFPGIPIVPGVYIIESMAQLLGVLLERSYPEAFTDDEEGVYAILSIVHKAKFRRFTIPGDRMELFGKIGTLDRRIANGTVMAKVDGELRAKADLSFVLIAKSQSLNPLLRQQRENYYHFLHNGVTIANHRSL